MKYHKLFLLLCSICFLSARGWAQQGDFKLNVGYVAGIPVGNLRNLVDKTSWRGWEASLMYDVSPKMSIGLATGMQDFYQKYPRTIIHSSGSDMSAVITNSIQTSPILVAGQYRLGQVSLIQPFVSLAAGGNIAHYRKFYGEFADEDSRLTFAAQGALGLHIPIPNSRLSGFDVSAGYNYMPYKYSDANGLNHVFVKAGLSIVM